jgi:L-erythro-3,5-diaminohexanoate dehydrogenase
MNTANGFAGLAAALGVDRSVSPLGVLPYLAWRLDARTPPADYEAGLDVEYLNVDATSYRQLGEAGGHSPDRMAELILGIVNERGKMQNPVTGSGGVLLGRVATVGTRYTMGNLQPGSRVVPLASLAAIPLRLSAVGPVDPGCPQVPVTGQAIVTGRMSCAAVPGDLPVSAVLTAYDVYPVASHVRRLARPGDHVLIVGAGHAGLLAMITAREVTGQAGQVTVVDASPAAIRRAATVDGSARGLVADATDTRGLLSVLSGSGVEPADLTVLCTTATGCEGSAIAATRRAGTVLFFSTATSFPAAALGADSMSSLAELIIPNGFTADRGEDAIDMLRRHRVLAGIYAAASPGLR